MPIFQDGIDLGPPNTTGPDPVAIGPLASRLRRLSEESLRTELCEGPVPDSPMRPPASRDGDEAKTSDRAELIEMLKRGESPTWIPNRHLEPFLQHDNSVDNDKTSQTSPDSPSLLPPARITPDRKNNSPDSADERLRDGLSLGRPRSALHSGDFTSDEAAAANGQYGEPYRQSNETRVSPEHVWLATSPPRGFTPFPYDKKAQFPDGEGSFKFAASPLSSLSSFAYQPPTSPLAQSETHEELDFPMPLGGIDPSSTRLSSSRRHTLASSLISPFVSPILRSPIPPRIPSQRREGSFSYQAHQPRRSLTSTPSLSQQHGTSPQTPAFLRSRRLSLGSDTSPMQHASMVGSYEESILRGRMSTTPSKPFDFLAQIGVLGKGNCKPSLRCPPHVTLPFLAVYYSYSSASHGRPQPDDGPSPYVGQIDLENGLPNLEEESRSRRKAQSRYTDRQSTGDAKSASRGVQGTNLGLCRTSRPRHRSGSPKAPPGGSYRIPEKGQVQIIVKNQNKTAVKLFLVPYDLSGMTPGTKTFIRQRSYSAGPIIDNVPNMSHAHSMDRPILRYLVHLHICCPSKGRHYLYKNIRIVFANRVPDGKERLHNETTWPEPRFTSYKPIRAMNPPLSASSGPGTMLAAEKAFRRRSLGVSVGASVGASVRAFDVMDAIGPPSRLAMEPPPSSFGAGNTALVDPIPLRLSTRDGVDSDISDETSVTAGLRSPGSSQASRPSTKDSGVPEVWGASQYEKLNKGDLGYGGNAFGPARDGGMPGAGAESLLSRSLRGMGAMAKPDSQEE